MTELNVSVIVATRNRQWDIDEMLASIARTGSTAVCEVIIADDGSTPPVRADGAGLPFPVVVVRSDAHVGASAMRNRAGQVAAGAIIAFLDDDARVFPDWFDVALSHVTPSTAITGRILPLDGGVVSRARQWRYEARYARVRPDEPVRFLAGGNSAVMADSFRLAGGFPEAVRSGGDNLLVERLEALGVHVRFVPELRILHRNGKGMRSAIREAWRSGETRRRQPLRKAGREMVDSLRSGPWRHDTASALTNLFLQVLHSVSSARRSRDTRAAS